MAFPTTGILDTFNRADGDPGANWSAPIGFDTKFTISGNAAAFPDFGNEGYWNATTFGPDSEVFLTYPTYSGSQQLWIRIQNPNSSGNEDGYRVTQVTSADEAQVFRVDNDTGTQLGSGISNTEANGDSLGVEMIGSTLTVYAKTGGTWASLDTRSDATYSTAGYIGFRGTSGSADDFGGGTVVAAAAPTPVTVRTSYYP